MKIVSRMLAILAIAGLCSLPLMAQKGATQKKPSAAQPAAKAKAQPPAGMPMPKPTAEMTKMLKAMVGTWKVSEKHEPSPMVPKGGTGEGTSKIWPGPGGLSLLQTYRSSGAMGSFSGFGTAWWDGKAQAYKGVWCDNGTPEGCTYGGESKWEGDKLVGTMESEMNGQKMTIRTTYSDFKPDSFVMSMEMGPDANSLQKMMTVTYTKLPAAAKSAEAPAGKKD